MKRRPRNIRTLVLAALPLVGSAHYYFIQRLVLEPGFPMIGAGLLALLGALVVVVAFARHRIPRRIAPAATVISALWLGASFVLLLVLAASDLLLFAADLMIPAAEASTGRLVEPQTHAFGVLSMTGAIVLFGALSVLRAPPVRRHEVRLERWPEDLDGYRILQLSDVHIGPILGRNFAEEVVRRANATKPDLVVITGDVVDGSVKHLADHVAPFGDLEGHDGVYFVTGNHEYFSRADPWVEHFESLGLRSLRNTHVAVGNGFDLVGVDDHYARMLGQGGEDLERALEGRDGSRPCILLAHNPIVFDEAAERGVDLQLSGHTHGGQIWPFGYVVRLVSPYLAGGYRKGRSHLYVSRGTGFWGPPMRLGAPAEITEIVIRCAEGHA